MEKGLESLNITRYSSVSELTEKANGDSVKIRAFILNIRTTRHVTFVTLRERLDTVQAVVMNNSETIPVKNLAIESFIELEGVVKSVKNPIFSCTIQNSEIEVTNMKILGLVTSTLPFNLKDASATEKEREENQSICNVSYNLRLDNRFLDFRTSQMTSIIRIIDGVMFSFRNYLRKEGFTEIKTPKIIQSGSEGGSNLFSLNYFDRKAYLAQSPQLYKQMAIIGGLKKVFEIGHVYRAEKQNTNRYLSEFVGLDIEMELDRSYVDVIHFIYNLFVDIFKTLNSEYKREIDIIRKYRHFEDLKYSESPIIIAHREAVDLLKAQGFELTYEDDFSNEQEKALGNIIKDLHNVDLFVVRDYPASARAFYTYVDPNTGATHSYDFIMRGEEILSGAERITDYSSLKTAIESKGINPETLSNYLEPFKYGAPPHAGCGIGLERFLKSYFGFDDIRYFSLFPRDSSRVYP